MARILFLIFLVPFFTFGQLGDKESVLSPSGNVVLFFSQSNDSITFHLGNTQTLKYTKSRTFYYPLPINSIQVNDNGTAILINKQTVYLPKTGMIETHEEGELYLPNKSLNAVLVNRSTNTFDVINLLGNYRINSGKLPRNSEFTQHAFYDNDKTLILRAQKYLQILTIPTLGALAKKDVKSYEFNSTYRYLLMDTDQGLQLWDFKESERIHNIVAAREFAKYAKKRALPINERHVGALHNTKLHPSGRYAVEMLQADDRYYFAIFDYATKQIVFHIDINPYFGEWTDLVTPHFKGNEFIMTAPSGKKVSFDFLSQNPSPIEASLLFPNEICNQQLQIDNIIITKDLEYSILVHQKILYLKRHSAVFPIAEYTNIVEASIDEKNQVILVKTKDNKFGVIDLRAKTPEDLKQIKWFNPLISPKEKVLEEGESDISDEFKGTVTRTQAKAPLTLVVRKAHTEEDKATVDFQIQDTTGQVITGLSSVENKSIWCKFLVRTPNGEVKYAEGIKLSETKGNSPMHISVVMDYSGSMGAERVSKMEQAVLRLAEKKEPSDLISVIQFDDNIKTDGKYTSLYKKVKQKIGKRAYENFGGGTALYDAILTSAYLLIGDRSQHKKSLVVITDGRDLGSMVSLTEVILFCKENNIQIYPLGFGQRVNDKTLQAMADHTGGEYNKIYNSNDFDSKLSSIYNNQRYFYSAEFDLDQEGIYSFIMKLCDDSLDTKFTQVSFTYQNDHPTQIDRTDTTYFLPIGVELPNIGARVDQQFPDSLMEDRAFYDGNYEKIEFEALTLPTFQFKKNKTVIVNDPTTEINALADYLKRNPEVKLVIEGHTDADGDFDYNIQLSKDRAEKVKSLLVAQGISGDRLFTKGYGSLRPLAKETDKETQQQNRRVVFKIKEE